MASKVVIVGGHGRIALRLACILVRNHTVVSIVRDPAHMRDIAATGATPLLLSLEDTSPFHLSSAFLDANVVVFAAGAGGKGNPERTKLVDYEGAVQVFDAIELVRKDFDMTPPRLLLVSAIDVRNPDNVPSYYDEEDLKVSARTWGMSDYMHWKYEADKNLVCRTEFEWTIVRPGWLSDEPGAGTASIGRTHISPTVSRDDVARTIALLVDRPDAAGLALDIVSGDTPIAEALDAAIKTRTTAWEG